MFTSARTVAIVFARSAGSEAMYCAGVVTLDGGFMDSSSFPNEVYHRTLENRPAAGAVSIAEPSMGFRGPQALCPQVVTDGKFPYHKFRCSRGITRGVACDEVLSSTTIHSDTTLFDPDCHRVYLWTDRPDLLLDINCLRPENGALNRPPISVLGPCTGLALPGTEAKKGFSSSSSTKRVPIP